MEPKARTAAAGIAMLAGGTLFAQIALDVFERGKDPLTAFAHLFGFFTIWSNGIVAIVAAHCGLVGRSRGLGHPAVLAASMVFIVVVGVVYNTLLAGLNHPPTLARKLTDHVFHIATPVLWSLWWFTLRPRMWLKWQYLWAVLPVPLLYCAMSLWMGAQTGRYTYFFVDVSLLGWPRTIINIAGFASLFALLMAAAIWWDRRTAASLAKG